MRIQLGGATGDVEGPCGRGLEESQHLVCGLGPHLFGTRGSRRNVAVEAALVAAIAHVDLHRVERDLRTAGKSEGESSGRGSCRGRGPKGSRDGIDAACRQQPRRSSRSRWRLAASRGNMRRHVRFLRGRSSAGRASRSQCEGREFDPPRLHQSTLKLLSLPDVGFDRRDGAPAPIFVPRAPRLRTGTKRVWMKERTLRSLRQATRCPGPRKGAPSVRLPSAPALRADASRGSHPLPAWKNWQVRWFIRRYGVDMSEALISDTARYPDFNSFFTRACVRRPVLSMRRSTR